MTLTGPACVSRLAKLVIGISLPTFDLGFKTWLRAYVGRPRTGNRYLNLSEWRISSSPYWDETDCPAMDIPLTKLSKVGV